MMKSLAVQYDLEDARAWLKRNFKPQTRRIPTSRKDYRPAALSQPGKIPAGGA